MNTTTLRGSVSHRLVNAVVGLAAIALTLAAGAPVPAEAQTTQSVAVYADINFWGSSLQFFGSVADLTGYGFNDRISSMRVPTGSVVAAYEHTNFGGRCETFRADDLDLRNNTIGNDTISSLRLGQACPVLLLSGTNYVGNILSADHDIPEFDYRLSNTMSSVRVQGNRVALYDLPFYGGMCESFNADDPDFGNNPILERASSLRFGVDCPPQGVVFDNTNYGGDYLVVPLNEPRRSLPAAWVDRPESVHVAGGAYLELENNFVQGTVYWFQPGIRCERFTADDPDLNNNIILVADGVSIGGIINQQGVDKAAAYSGPAPLTSINCMW